MTPFRVSRDYEAVDDFDEYDPTPYSGGYDQALTYGRPLPQSDETCYPVSVAGDIDYERPNYSSNSQNSIYEADEADFGDRYGRPRPKPQNYNSSYADDEGAGGKYGSEYGSGYGGRTHPQEYGSEYESGYGGGRPKRDEDEGYTRKTQYGSGYGSQVNTTHYANEGCGEQGYDKGRYRTDEEGYVKQSYGGGNFRSDEVGYGHENYGGEAVEGFGGGGAFRRNEESEYGGRTNYERPSYGVNEEGDGRYNKSAYGYKESGRYKKSGDGNEEESSGYGKLGSFGGEEGGYERFKYGDEPYEGGENKHAYQKHHHFRRHNRDED